MKMLKSELDTPCYGVEKSGKVVSIMPMTHGHKAGDVCGKFFFPNKKFGYSAKDLRSMARYLDKQE